MYETMVWVIGIFKKEIAFKKAFEFTDSIDTLPLTPRMWLNNSTQDISDNG